MVGLLKGLRSAGSFATVGWFGGARNRWSCVNFYPDEFKGPKSDFLCPGCQNHVVGRKKRPSGRRLNGDDLENVFQEGLIPIHKTRRETARGAGERGKEGVSRRWGGEMLPFWEFWVVFAPVNFWANWERAN